MKSHLSKLLLAVGFVSVLGASTSYADIQRLGDERFKQIHAGLTQDEVRAIVGAPVTTESYPRLNETLWAYPFMDTWGYNARFDVTFDQNGVVKEAFPQRLGR